MNMYKLLEQIIQKSPKTVFLVRENITFEELPKYIKARATSLREFGVKPGDTVGLLSHNIPEFVSTLFAIWYLGARALLLDTNLTAEEYNNMTQRAD